MGYRVDEGAVEEGNLVRLGFSEPHILSKCGGKLGMMRKPCQLLHLDVSTLLLKFRVPLFTSSLELTKRRTIARMKMMYAFILLAYTLVTHCFTIVT